MHRRQQRWGRTPARDRRSRNGGIDDTGSNKPRHELQPPKTTLPGVNVGGQDARSQMSKFKIVEQRAAPWTGCVRDIQLPEKRLSTHRVQRQQHELNAHHTPYRVHVLPPHTRIRDRRPLRAQACNRARTLSNTCVEIKWWWGLLASSISLGLSHCSTH